MALHRPVACYKGRERAPIKISHYDSDAARSILLDAYRISSKSLDNLAAYQNCNKALWSFYTLAAVPIYTS